MADTVRRPNVLIFMTDQQNGRSILDGSGIRAITPNLDRFRAKAVTFAEAYGPSPHCCPSRASFHTGLYPSRHGVWNNVNVANALSRGPRRGTGFWSRDFVRAGYELVFSGKWHVSNHEGPEDFGWQVLHATGRPFSKSADPEDQRVTARAHEARMFGLGGKPRRTGASGEIVRPGWPAYSHYGTNEDPFGDRRVVEAATGWLRARDGAAAAPWMLFVGTLGPHDPYVPPKEYLDWYDLDDIELPSSFDDPMTDKPGLYSRTRLVFDQLSRDEHREAIRHYLAFCSYEDALFGRLLDALEVTGQAEATTVLFLSDHGDYVGDHGLWAKGLPSFRGAYHVPLVIGGAGVAAAGAVTNAPATLLDIGPTLLELCGVPSDLALEGISLAPVLTGATEDASRDLFFQSNGNEAYGIQRIVVSDGWKLVYNMFDHDELYNLGDDPDEMCNLLAPGTERKLGVEPLGSVPTHLKDRVRDLYGRLWRFARDHEDDITDGYIMTALASFGPGVTSDGAGPEIAQERVGG